VATTDVPEDISDDAEASLTFLDIVADCHTG
jgi:hypothetical protein